MKIIDLAKEPEYIPKLAEWHHNEWSHLNPQLSLEERIEKMNDFLSNEFIPSTYICKDSDSLAGSAAIVESDMDTKPELTPWLASVFVSPKYRNKGIGSALVNQIISSAQSRGVKKLYLFTPTKEIFYSHLGWSTISRENYRGQQVVVMSINLNS